MTLRVGVVGCGNISDNYFQNAPLFQDLNYVACADLRTESAAAKAAQYGVEAVTLDDLFRRDDIDLVLNLTIPAAHAEISLRAIEAGKHVFSEKPMAIDLVEAERIISAGKAKGVRVGIAPDTVLGPGVQLARGIIDEGQIGSVVTGLAAVLSHGMEDWHPNPTFFFQRGGGPVLDLGPYYISALVHLLGPVREVHAAGRIGTAERLVTAEGPMNGKSIKVETFTTVNALLSFASGAELTFLASWDVWSSDLRPIELHGTEGSLRVPDPNNFAGSISSSRPGQAFSTTETTDLPFGSNNRLWAGEYPYSCYRGLGMADMARSIELGKPHRCSAELGLHALEVLLAMEEAAQSHRTITLKSTCDRPAILTAEEAGTFLKTQIPAEPA
jgi:predicted dehydrogenase